MARPRLCDDMARFIFFPGVVDTRLRQLAGKNKSRFLRSLLDKAEIPDADYERIQSQIDNVGRNLVKVGRIRDIDSGKYIPIDDMDLRLDKMIEAALHVENLGNELLQLKTSSVKNKNLDRLSKVDQIAGKAMEVRMERAQYNKLKAIADRAGMSMAAVLRAWVLNLSLPDKSLELAGDSLKRVGLLMKHIAGQWRKFAQDLKNPGLAAKTDRLYMKGQAVSNLSLKVIMAQVERQKKAEELEQS